MVYAFVIEPASYVAFADEEEQLDKLKEWDLVSGKAIKAKTFYYKGNGLKEVCGIVGYVDHMTAVIELPNKQKHCIHPSYLKEMQAANFGQRYASAAETEEAVGEREETAAETSAETAAVAASPASVSPRAWRRRQRMIVRRRMRSLRSSLRVTQHPRRRRSLRHRPRRRPARRVRRRCSFPRKRSS